MSIPILSGTFQYCCPKKQIAVNLCEIQIVPFWNYFIKGETYIQSSLPPRQGIFYDGQVYDAYTFVTGLVKRATTEIVLIDNYIDDEVYPIGASIKDFDKKWFAISRMEDLTKKELVNKINGVV